MGYPTGTPPPRFSQAGRHCRIAALPRLPVVLRQREHLQHTLQSPANIENILQPPGPGPDN